MIIKPKIRGFICTTTHPTGCAQNVREQIEQTQKQDFAVDGPKRVLVIGSSSGYGLASRITAAFGYGAATIGVFFEKPATERKTGTAGWYNSAAFEAEAKNAGLYAKSLNGDAFSHDAKQKAVDLIKQDLGQVDLVVYSLAAPVRKMPDTGEVIRSCLKPIDNVYRSTAIDTNKDAIIETEVEPASQEEIDNTVTVMGGQDWQLWMDALAQADVLSPEAKAVAYSYIGTELTWPIYWDGALGKAKQDLDSTAMSLNTQREPTGGSAHVAVLKSVVTQASSAIPVMPLYISMAFKIMKDLGTHEGCIEQINRMFAERLYSNADLITDESNRIRLDDWELRDDVQNKCRELWPQITTENLADLTDYTAYKAEFLKLFGFGVSNVDYDADVNPIVDFDVIDI